MPTNDKPLWHRLKNANASTLATMLKLKMIKQRKSVSAKEKIEAVEKPVRKRIRGNVFDDDGTDN